MTLVCSKRIRFNFFKGLMTEKKLKGVRILPGLGAILLSQPVGILMDVQSTSSEDTALLGDKKVRLDQVLIIEFLRDYFYGGCWRLKSGQRVLMKR